jgi:dipeptidase D
MQDKIIKEFVALTKIPHCSKKADGLLEYLKEFAIDRGYSVEIDEAKNLLVKKGNPKLALQAHYDMVCMGEAPKIETYIKDGWMGAKNSSLGADNGIAIAMMMVLMDMGRELEFIFTSDEEIGLIGASKLNFNLNSQNMLNIDFEDEAEVCIGCAGGADLLANSRVKETKKLKYNYRVSVSNLAGGHSGVDIDKNIPNAIKVLIEYLKDKKVSISSFSGGERRNSIPVNATAIVSSIEILESSYMVEVERLEGSYRFYDAENFIDILDRFKDGVNSYNSKFGLPDTSINLAIVNFENGNISIEATARAMSAEGLEEITQKNIKLFEEYGFRLKEEYKYPAWRPEINDFTKEVYSSVKRVFGRSEYKAIHAGLECGVISKRYPNMKFASIGPTIIYPHSINEKIKLDSIEKTFKVILGLINKS